MTFLYFYDRKHFSMGKTVKGVYEWFSNKKLIIIVGLFVLVVSVFVYFGKGVIYEYFNAAGLIPKKEYYTELYFNDYSKIRKWKEEGQQKGKPITFSFVIHNMEERDFEYTYFVYFESSDGVVSWIAKKKAILKSGEARVIPVTFAPNGLKGAVYVVLPELNQTVHFLIEK